MAMGNPITRTSHRSRQGVFSHLCLRKASVADSVITGLASSAGIAGGHDQCPARPAAPWCPYYPRARGSFEPLSHGTSQAFWALYPGYGDPSGVVATETALCDGAIKTLRPVF